MDAIVERLGYVALGMEDIDAASDFYRSIGGLSVSERRKDAVFLTGGIEHHWLSLHSGWASGQFKIGLEVSSTGALDRLTDSLSEWNIAHIDDDSLTVDLVDRSVRFTSPDGTEIECYTQMAELPSMPIQRVRMVDLLHAIWLVESAPKDLVFYRDVLGFRESDWIQCVVVFLRAGNAYHHSVGLVGGGAGVHGLNHICVIASQSSSIPIAENSRAQVSHACNTVTRLQMLLEKISGLFTIFLART